MELEQTKHDPHNDDSPKWLTEAVINQLKAEHGDIYLIQIPDPDLPNAALVIKHPDRKARPYKDFIARARKGKKHEERAFETFTLEHIVYPTGQELEDILKLHPGLTLVAGTELVALTRQTQEKQT
jgi:hypothetical protein